MLISFSVKNFLSFKEEATISMIASRQTTFNETLAKIHNKNRVLPLAAIYGGNASGKTNFCEALAFARDMIISTNSTSKDEKIKVAPFYLCKENTNYPTSFSFIIITLEENMYEYSFSFDSENIQKEKLVRIGKTSEEILFERIFNEYPILGKNDRLRTISLNTRKNKLFLTNTVEQNYDEYEDVFIWFKGVLKIITPEALFVFESVMSEDKDWFKNFQHKVNKLDTGIVRIEEERIELPNMSKDKDIDEYLHEYQLTNHERLIKRTENGKDVYNRFVTYHKCRDGEEVPFYLPQESDGTIRLLDILPAFITPNNSMAVIIIDEIDKSLHYMLIKSLLENYLKSCSKDTRKQIIFTTHNLLLMDQDLMRRDEIFLVEKDAYGESNIKSVSDFKEIRIDKDVRKSYLLGRFGGVPKL